MRHVTIFIFLFSMVFSRALLINTNNTPLLQSTKSAMVIEDFNKENTRNPSSREEIILFDWNFETEEAAWNTGSGWEWTDASAADTSIYSYLSPNTEATYGSVWNLTSPNVTLPELGDGELMRFKFSLWGDMPDTDGDGDDFLDDYYSLSIMNLAALSWHASSAAPGAEGNSYWCADEAIGPDGGYLDEWMQYLDTPATIIGEDASVSAKVKWNLEDEAGADGAISGSCTNGWDAANVRVSTDGGMTWSLLEDPNVPYDFDCGYGWIYNDPAYEAGGALNNVAAGWGGVSSGTLGSDGWYNASFDLSAYTGEEVIVRFAFGSDPAYSTFDQTDMTGFVVDNIIIEDATGVQYSDNADDSGQANTMVASGEVWEAMFYDYTDETRPGGNGWEEYLPGLAFNGNVLHDISHLAGKEIIVKFASRYDDNDDGGAGQGLFIDDFIIYKESSGNFPAPADLMVESGDEEALLIWQDLNASGENEDFSFDNGTFGTNLISMTAEGAVGFAGTSFNFPGTSTIHTVDYFHTSGQTDFQMNICAYSSQGSLFSSNADGCVNVETSGLTGGWNTIDIPEWEMSGNFILAHSFNDSYGAALDETADGSHSYFSALQGNGSNSAWQSELSGDGSFEGEWGIRANISYQGANATYNVQRDGVQVASVLTSNMYTDTGLTNNTEYSYSVSATYEDGTESDPSELVTVIPQAQTVHQESYDDGTSEAGWAPEGSGQFAAVRYAGHDAGEQVMRYKWFQEGGGGAFYIKVWSDDNGYPGTEIYSGIQVSGNSDGWNEVDLTDANLTVTCDFWVGVKRFSSTSPIGVDTDSNSGNSMSSDNGTDWMVVEGNVMVRIFIDEGEGGNDCGINSDLCVDTIPGDTNLDGGINVLDVVTLVGYILGNVQLEDCGLIAADYNGDEIVNILDVVIVVGTILNGRLTDASSATINTSIDGVSISADGYIGAVELTLSHDLGFSLSLTDKALVADYNTDGTRTKLIIVAPEDEQIFITSDIFTVDEVLVANSESFIEVIEVVTEFGLSIAYPNPFNPTTTLEFSAIEAGYASVKVYNLMGQVVGVLLDGIVEPNTYSLTWNANNLSSGVYMIKAESSSQVSTQKIMLLK